MSSSFSSSDSSSDVEEQFEVLSLKENKEINILLLGETGVGKSTFINAVGNFTSLRYFSEAEEKGLTKVIPTIYQIQDKNGRSQTVKIGPKKDENETLKTGESATQNVKTYVFPICNGHAKIRLIDTPGMGDTRGVAQDEINGENIIHYIKNLDYIHAICFLCKPTQTRKTVDFDYRVYQILSLLEKSSANNIFFLFSHTRGSDYGPGDTLPVLKKILKNIEADTGLKIPIDKDKNLYCFDNEAFKYLGACEKKIQFDPSARDRYRSSWVNSARQFWNFIKYLQRDIRPYVPSKLVDLSFARKTVIHFSQVLSEITKETVKNEHLSDRLKDNINSEQQSITSLKSSGTKVTDVLQNKMCQPMLVCTASPSCAEVFRVNGENKWHYKRMCHSCYELGDDTPMFMTGSPSILNCHVINTSNRRCNQCGCDFMYHMHVNYITYLKEEQRSDDDIPLQIGVKESLTDSYKNTVKDIEMQNTQLLNEHTIIKNFCMNIARFIRNTAIISYSNSYKQYLTYLINQKKSTAASSVQTSLADLNDRLLQYEEVEKIFKDVLKVPTISKESITFSVKDVRFQYLFQLKTNGQKLKALYEIQKASSSQTITVKEYVHDKYYVKSKEDRKQSDSTKTRPSEKRDYKKNQSSRGSENRYAPKNADRSQRPSSRNADYPPRRDSRNADYPARPDSRNSAYNYPPRPDSRSSTSSHNANSYSDQSFQQAYNYTGHPNYHQRDQSQRGREVLDFNISVDYRNSPSAVPGSYQYGSNYEHNSAAYGGYAPNHYIPPLLNQVYHPPPPYNGYPQNQGNLHAASGYYQDNRYMGNSAQDQNRNRGRYNKNLAAQNDRPGGRNTSKGPRNRGNKRRSGSKQSRSGNNSDSD